jgi:hypothetical protein
LARASGKASVVARIGGNRHKRNGFLASNAEAVMVPRAFRRRM